MPEASWFLTFLVLVGLELILGFDNILMITLISQRTNEKKEKLIQCLGIVFASLNRILLILFLGWITKLENSLIKIGTIEIAVRDIIFLIGGSFLIYKSIKEIYFTIEHKIDFFQIDENKKQTSVVAAIFQILIIDAVFSIDSVIAAMGLTENIILIISSIIISVIFMILFIGKISNFIKNNSPIKITALAIMLIIGITLCLEAFDTKIPKYYIVSLITFAAFIQVLQLRYDGNKRKKRKKNFLRSFNKKAL